MKNYSDSNYSLEKCKDEYLAFLRSIKRDGMDKLISYLEKHGFFQAPASTGKNESREGGQLRHALNVMTRMIMNVGSQDVLASEKVQNENAEKAAESIAIVALLSGIWKACYFRKTMRKVSKEDGTVEKIYGYGIRPAEDRLCYGRDDDHGDEAVYILQGFIRLSREEAFAIRSQSWDPHSDEARRVFLKHKLAFHYHIAELQAIYLDEVD